MARSLVSVIIPSFNHAPYLTQRIESVLAQTYQDFELILLDDASKDKSRKIIKNYQTHAKVSHVLINEQNSGSAFLQWARGLDLAIGEFVWIAESDDWADPVFLETMLPILNNHPNIGLGYCQSWIVNKKGKTLGDTLEWTADLDPTRWQADFVNDGKDEIQRFLTVKNTIPSASAVLFRRKVMAAILPLERDYRLCGDWLIWMRMLAQSDVAYCAKQLNYWRENTSNARMASPGTLEWLEGETVLREAAHLVGLDTQQTTEMLFRFLRQCWQWQKEYIEQIDKN